MTQTLGILVGSLRQNSYNRIVADTFRSLIPSQYDVTEIAIAHLPFYNEDLDTTQPPVAWTDFRQTVQGVAGILIFSPEYNRGVPAVLKNAFDVGSRPRGQNVFAGKPALVVTASPGAIGGYAANNSIRQTLTFLDMPTLQQPEAYIGNVNAHLSEDGGKPHFKPDTVDFFSLIVERYIAFFEKITA